MTELEALAMDYANALVQYNDCLMAHAMHGGRELHLEVLRAADVVYVAQDNLNREAAQVAASLGR
jgi:hypothetical protein